MKKLLPIALIGLAAIVSAYAAFQVLVVAPTTSRVLAEEALVRSKIAGEYGVDDDWRSARYAIYCIVFRSGRSMSDLESELTRLGKWTSAGSLGTKAYTLNGLNAGIRVIAMPNRSPAELAPILLRTRIYQLRDHENQPKMETARMGHLKRDDDEVVLPSPRRRLAVHQHERLITSGFQGGDVETRRGASLLIRGRASRAWGIETGATLKTEPFLCLAG